MTTTSLWLDSSGSTRQYWSEHVKDIEDAVNKHRGMTTDVRTFDTGSRPYTRGIPEGAGGGTNPATIANWLRHNNQKALIVTDDVLVMHEMWRDAALREGVDLDRAKIISFEEFLGANEIGEILALSREMHDEVLRLLYGEESNKTVMNKRAIDLHMKLDRLASDVLDLETHGVRDKRLDSAKALLNNATGLILREVFRLDPSTKRTKKEEPVAPALTARTVSGGVKVDSVFVDDEYATVELSFNGAVVEAHAKRDPEDKPNETIGLTLAAGRAFRKLGGQLINDANQAVVAADKERRREKATKDQARSEQRKAEAKVQREKDAVTRLAEMEKKVSEGETIIERLMAVIDKQEAAEAARKKRAAKRAATTHKAAAKTTKRR